jgi:CheY-like chemotaxis protein
MAKRILLVEDTLDVLYSLRDFLRLEGFEISIAVDGIDALDALRQNTPDLVITDLRMPNMDGFAFMEKLKKKEELKSIPVIVFSANGAYENEARSMALGAYKFLKKPSSAAVILESIQEVLGHS